MMIIKIIKVVNNVNVNFSQMIVSGFFQNFFGCFVVVVVVVVVCYSVDVGK